MQNFKENNPQRNCPFQYPETQMDLLSLIFCCTTLTYCIIYTKSLFVATFVQVNLLDVMENMDEETFEFRFGEELVYTTLLSDGQMVELIPGGSNVAVHYEDRSEFIRLVQKARLEESKKQV